MIICKIPKKHWVGITYIYIYILLDGKSKMMLYVDHLYIYIYHRYHIYIILLDISKKKKYIYISHPITLGGISSPGSSHLPFIHTFHTPVQRKPMVFWTGNSHIPLGSLRWWSRWTGDGINDGITNHFNPEAFSYIFFRIWNLFMKRINQPYTWVLWTIP